MAIGTGKKVKCPLCGYSHEDLEYKVTTNGVLYYICPYCDYWVRFGKKSREILAKMGLKFNRKENELERLENAKKEENRNNEQGIEANSSENNRDSGRTEEPRNSWSPF